jgi:hypothetical protein
MSIDRINASAIQATSAMQQKVVGQTSASPKIDAIKQSESLGNAEMRFNNWVRGIDVLRRNGVAIDEDVLRLAQSGGNRPSGPNELAIG